MESIPPEPETGVYEYDDVPPRGYAVYEMDLWLEGSKEITYTETTVRIMSALSDESRAQIEALAAELC